MEENLRVAKQKYLMKELINEGYDHIEFEEFVLN